MSPSKVLFFNDLRPYEGLKGGKGAGCIQN
jgi:hypothetical protein